MSDESFAKPWDPMVERSLRTCDVSLIKVKLSPEEQAFADFCEARRRERAERAHRRIVAQLSALLGRAMRAFAARDRRRSEEERQAA